MPKALIKIVAAGSALALLCGAAWAQTPSDADRYAYGPHMMWWGGGWYGMIFGPLFMLLISKYRQAMQSGGTAPACDPTPARATFLLYRRGFQDYNPAHILSGRQKTSQSAGLWLSILVRSTD